MHASSRVPAYLHARMHTYTTTYTHTSVQTDSDRQSVLACVGRHGVEAAAVLCIHRSIHEVQVRRLLIGQTHQRHLRCEDHFREVETSPHTLASKAGVCSWYACVCVRACACVCVCEICGASEGGVTVFLCRRVSHRMACTR